MVTHNWNNVFGNLLSAILADALGLSAHQEIAVKIATTSGFQQVRAKLTGKLETTYWVCAFSINQHASICAGFGPEPLQWTAEWAAWDRRRKDCLVLSGEWGNGLWRLLLGIIYRDYYKGLGFRIV